MRKLFGASCAILLIGSQAWGQAISIAPSQSATPTGTAGSPNAAVVTIQGITGGTPQPVSPPTGGLQTTLSATSARVRGAVSASTTTPATIIAAQGAGTYIHVSSCQFGRTDTGTGAMYVTLSDAQSTIIVIPGSAGGGGNNPQFEVPLVLAANSPLTFTENTTTATVYGSCQGWQDAVSN